MRSPWATAGIGLGKTRGAVTQLNLKMKKCCLCRRLLWRAVCSHGHSPPITVSLSTTLSHSVSPMYVSRRNSTGKAKVRISAGEFGKGVRCTVADGPGFPVLFTSRQWLQAGWLLEPAHSCHLSSLWSTSSVLQAGWMDGLITNDFTDSLWQERTELNLAPPKYPQTGQGEPSARPFPSLAFVGAEQRPRASVRGLPRVWSSQSSPRFAQMLRLSWRQCWSGCWSHWSAQWVSVCLCSKVLFRWTFLFFGGQHLAISTVKAVFLKGYVQRSSCLRPSHSSDILIWSPDYWPLLPALNHRQPDLIQPCLSPGFVSGVHLELPSPSKGKAGSQVRSYSPGQPPPLYGQHRKKLLQPTRSLAITAPVSVARVTSLTQFPHCPCLRSQQGKGSREQNAENVVCWVLFKAMQCV